MEPENPLRLVQRVKEHLPLRQPAAEPQPLLPFTVIHGEEGHQGPAQPLGKRLADRRLPAQSHDAPCLANLTLYPIHDGACRQADASVIGIHDHHHRPAFANDFVQFGEVGKLRMAEAQPGP